MVKWRNGKKINGELMKWFNGKQVHMVEWWNVEVLNSPQWVYGEMSKLNDILFLPSTTPFPTVTERTN